MTGRRMVPRVEYVTPMPWKALLQHPVYGERETYRCAADWLEPCRVVADWGGAQGHLAEYLAPSCGYLRVDGTLQSRPGTCQILADLANFHERTEGIALRHVLDMTEEWLAVLRNALRAFTRRLVVVTFTPDVPVTQLVKRKSGWPLWHFNPDDLRAEMGPLLVREQVVQTSHPERVYYLERPCAS